MEAYNYSESPRDLNSPHDPSENGYSFARNNRPHYSSQHSSHPSGASTVMNAGSASQSTTAVSTVSTEAPSSTTTANAFAYRNGRRMSSSSASRLEGKEVDGPVGFDEGIVNGSCDMDCALPLLGDRIKQSVASCKQISGFFRQRSEVEEKYARGLGDMARQAIEVYSKMDCKAGSFVQSYQQSLRMQEQLAQNRIRFAQRLGEMSEELASSAREGEKQRKIHKDNGARFQAILQDSETVMDKAKARFDATAEELERISVAKEGESYRDAGMRNANAANHTAGNGTSANKNRIGKAMTKGLFKGKNPAQMQRHEDDVRQRMAGASEAFRKAVLESQASRQEYFSQQSPKIVRLSKDCADELDLGIQYHLTRYAFMYESTVVGEGSILCPPTPEDGSSSKQVFESIDNRSDFKAYMQNYAVARNIPKGPRREGPYDENFNPTLPPHVQASTSAPGGPVISGPTNVQTNPVPPPNGSAVAVTSPPQNDYYSSNSIPASTGATFGVDLGDQLQRDGTEVPKIVKKCAEAIEAYGLESMGIYRLSGTTSKVQALKNALDKDIDSVDVMDEQWTSDINVVSGASKLWFRESPEPSSTYGLYHGFIEAARYDNDRLRHIRSHEQVNESPDPNYATSKYFMGHSDRIRRKEGVNQMSASNLSIVFGPTLLGAPPEEGGLNSEHMNFQCKAIETISEKYQEIFVEEEEA